MPLENLRRAPHRCPHGIDEQLALALDFKGQFRTGDGLYCYPLTVADLHSCMLPACDSLLSTKSRGAKPVLERLFREHGLPRAIRTDNGLPFPSTGPHGLTQLNVWWVHRHRAQAHPARASTTARCARAHAPHPRTRSHSPRQTVLPG